MDNLSLHRTLRKLGAASLTGIIGQDIVGSMCSIMKGRVTEGQLAKIILNKHSSQILSNKLIRNKIIHSLTKTHLKFLSKGDSNSRLTESDLEKLENFAWSRKSEITRRFLELFELDESYLPPVKEKIVSHAELETSVSLFPYQKKIKDRFVHSLFSNQKRVLIHMPTGSGKTRTSIEGLVDYWRAFGEIGGFLISS